MENENSPQKKHSASRYSAGTREAVRLLLHEFYIEIATTRMSKERFDELVEQIIDAANDTSK
jgi:hypothetical protein